MSYGSPQDPSRSGTREFNTQHEITMLKERVTKLEASQNSTVRPAGWMAGAGSAVPLSKEEINGFTNQVLQLTQQEVLHLLRLVGCHVLGTSCTNQDLYVKLKNLRGRTDKLIPFPKVKRDGPDGYLDRDIIWID